MALQYKYDAQYAGKVYKGSTYFEYNPQNGVPNPFEFNVRLDYNSGQPLMAMQQLTGYFLTYSKVNYYQTTTGVYIIVADWTYVGTKTLPTGSYNDAQKYVDGITKANAHIIQNNLLCARFATKLTADEQLLLYQLQLRLEERNRKLLEDGLCYNQQVSSPPGYSDLSLYLDDFMKKYGNGEEIKGVGVVTVSTTVLVVIACVVVASLGAAAYFAYKAMYKESSDDVKFSDDLTRKLTSKLTDEEYNELVEETQGIVTKAKITTSLSNTGAILKWGLIIIGGLAIYTSINGKGRS